MPVFLLLAAIFPVSNTIALVNILILVMILSVTWIYLAPGMKTHVFSKLAWSDIPFALKLWLGYLLIFPLMAIDPGAAWSSLWREWLFAISTGLLGWFVCVIYGPRSVSVFTLALVNSLPSLIHLLLCICAAKGWLNTDFYNYPSLYSAVLALLSAARSGAGAPMPWHEIFSGFRGVEPMHGNIGYPACQAIILYWVCAYANIRRGAIRANLIPIIGMALCFLSIFIAQSRGALIFGMLIILLATLFVFVQQMWIRSRLSVHGKDSRNFRYFFLAAIVFVGVACSAVVTQIQHDLRWRSMVDKIEIGFSVDDPIDALCNGISPQVENDVRLRYAASGKAYVDDILTGLRVQDGGRVLLLRAGLHLVSSQPLGLDGSRNSFKKILEARCGHTPVLSFAHSHNGWIDLALSLGWIGAILFMLTFFTMIKFGLTNFQRDPDDVWALSLLVIGFFWFFRGFADAVYREHFLKMQWLLMMYLYGQVRLKTNAGLNANGINGLNGADSASKNTV